MITVTATLQQKKNIYYAVLYYKDEFNNIQQKWISTKLKVKNKLSNILKYKKPIST